MMTSVDDSYTPPAWAADAGSSAPLENENDFRNGARFLKGCFCAVLLSTPLWLLIVLLAF
jgi:hypothetical protein